MYFENKNGLKLLKFSNLAAEPGLIHAVSTRPGGVSQAPYSSLNLGANCGDSKANVKENLRRLCHSVNLPFDKIVAMRQIHSANVKIIEHAETHLEPPFRVPDVDALITAVKGLPILALSADCALTVFYDGTAGVLAVAHSGWRGAMLNIYKQVISTMTMRFGSIPDNIRVGIAPMIASSDYPVKDDFIQTFRELFSADTVERCLFYQSGLAYFSLRDLLELQLRQAGVMDYEFALLNTYTEKDLFYSWRRDGKNSGRFGLIASLL